MIMLSLITTSFAVATLFSISIEAAPSQDKVTSLPGFEPFPENFDVYSGFLNVTFPKPVGDYDAVVIHYQFHTSRGDPSTDPVVAWVRSYLLFLSFSHTHTHKQTKHTGGPGGSSVYFQYAEGGYFQVSLDHDGKVQTSLNDKSWNKVANMLFMESPAGSFLTPVDLKSGFSYCLKNGVRQDTCHWNDVTQAEAYAFTLEAFFEKFPEFKKNDLYFAGESYGGQYVPLIANEVLENHSDLASRLKGIAVGNGCFGGDEHSIVCNGDNADQNDVTLYYGKGLISKKLYDKIMSTCEFPKVGLKCELLLKEMDDEVGPHNVYNIYDNCPGGAAQFLEDTGLSMRWLKKFLRSNAHDLSAAHQELNAMSPQGGGYNWLCGQFDAIPQYFKGEDVRKALHLPLEENGSLFKYDSSGPASVLIYPSLIQSKLRVLIYNGDADSCVPYVGNKEWTVSMESSGVVKETSAWHPWYLSEDKTSGVTGYATEYSNDFTFITIRLAGHQVPKNNPEAALVMITKFLNGDKF